jgi:hypothetical protein
MRRRILGLTVFSIGLLMAISIFLTAQLSPSTGQLSIPDELLVKFRPGTPLLTVHDVNTQIGAFVLDRSLGDPDLYRVQIRPGLRLDEAIRRYEMNPNVVRAGPNALVFIPEDRGDGFDDIIDGSRFFSEGRTFLRWGVGQNARCDLLVRRPWTVPDRVVEALFFDRAGKPGSNWTLASYMNTENLGDLQSPSVTASTTDGTSFSGKTGRVGVGFIDRTVTTNGTCPLSGLPYTEHSFAASVVAGVQLDDGRPFWHIDPPYMEKTYPPIRIADLNEVQISMDLISRDLTLRIVDAKDRTILFTVTEPVPVRSWSGTRSPVFAYFGVVEGTRGALFIRSFGAR